ncbi:MAG: hypothetical protein HN405_04735 [Planctomycetes bacterium]|nr:hypothetical protein [Planctomycetota bacterium]MBT4560585.1 hypothetical protein [Planctomycetota bacterium]MBT5102120.1 hypothetical protein [Planctomycetota bacterium]
MAKSHASSGCDFTINMLALPLIWLGATLAVSGLACPQKPEQGQKQAQAQAETQAEQSAIARGVTLTPPQTPAQHYLFTGEVTFLIGKREPVTQGVQILLGGPDRLRFTLTSEKRSNTFLFSGARKPEEENQSWVKTPKAKQARKNPVDTIDRDTWLRWSLARFPWGWDFPTTKADTAEISGPFGSIRASLVDSLPSEIQLDGLKLSLSDWEKTPTGAFPKTWSWQYAHGLQIERFSETRGAMLCLENAFLPAHLAINDQGSWTGVRASAEASLAHSPDQIELIRQPDLYWLAADSNHEPNNNDTHQSSPGSTHGHWLRIEKKTATAVRLVSSDTPGAQLQKGGTYLRWSLFAPAQPIADAQNLLEAARFNKMKTAGPVWMTSTPDDGRVRRRMMLIRIKK